VKPRAAAYLILHSGLQQILENSAAAYLISRSGLFRENVEYRAYFEENSFFFDQC
jgi:hypothetical protein